MTSLREIQLGFAEAIRDPGATARFAARVHAGGLTAGRRLQLYRNNHRATLADALAAVYPAVLRLVGEPFFRQTARAYIASHPSDCGDIHRYGEPFGDFLDLLPQGADYPYLGDVARLEWAYHRVFHAERHAPLDLKALAAVAPADYPRLRFEFPPATRLLASDYPVLRIWEANREGSTGEAVVRLDAGGTRLLITREALEVLLVPLEPGEHVLLEGLAAGDTLAAATSTALALDPDLDAGRILRRHVALGTLVGWRL